MTHRAAGKGELPVLVAYNIPFRDCAQYSAGGATTVAEYEAWIDAVAAGIGDREAVVLLEPDGLGIIPWYTPNTGSGRSGAGPPRPTRPPRRATGSRCSTTPSTPSAPTRARRVYLDGTHSAWLGVGTSPTGSTGPGVERADGFFLNVSNYRTTSDSLTYGDWISQCLWYGTNPAEGGWRLGHFEYCASQYYPSSGYDDTTATDQWYLDNVTNAANPPQGPRTSRTSSSTPAATARARGRRRPASTPTRRTGATRPAAASACARRPTPATRWPTPSCGSRSRASPTASARAG